MSEFSFNRWFSSVKIKDIEVKAALNYWLASSEYDSLDSLIRLKMTSLPNQLLSSSASAVSVQSSPLLPLSASSSSSSSSMVQIQFEHKKALIAAVHRLAACNTTALLPTLAHNLSSIFALCPLRLRCLHQLCPCGRKHHYQMKALHLQ